MRQFQLSNANGASMEVINLGAAIVSLNMPDRWGDFQDVVLGLESPVAYLNNPNYFGAVIGRVANRISQAQFKLGATAYPLVVNAAPNHLHGGPGGFHQRCWSVCQESWQSPPNRLQFGYISEDGEEGYPGKLKVGVSYELTDDNAVLIDYCAVSDQPTVVNLTQHSCFNLSGHAGGEIDNHFLKVHADQYLPLAENQIPSGAIDSLDSTPMDFRDYRRLGNILLAEHRQLELGLGLDQYYVLAGGEEDLNLAAELREETSGRSLAVYTDQPGLQVYTGNHIAPGTRGKSNVKYGPRHGICLETQHYPDAPNQPNFPSIMLLPGQRYQSRTKFQFGTFD
ncbi:MAG: aldose epimerase family protein [Halioglobus sp.]